MIATIFSMLKAQKFVLNDSKPFTKFTHFIPVFGNFLSLFPNCKKWINCSGMSAVPLLITFSYTSVLSGLVLH